MRKLPAKRIFLGEQFDEPGTDRKSSKLSNQVYQKILESIVNGEVAVNERLPTEEKLASQFDVSRPIVREALARLRDDGLIYSRQGAGSFVQRRPEQDILRFAPVGSIADVQRCFEYRTAVEGEAAFMAARRRDESSLKEIAQALKELDRVIKGRGVGVDADFNFHMAVARATHNRFYVTTMESLRSHTMVGMNLTRNLSLLHSAARLALVQAEHSAVYEAIAKGDPKQARSAMRTHIENARQRIFESRPEGDT